MAPSRAALCAVFAVCAVAVLSAATVRAADEYVPLVDFARLPTVPSPYDPSNGIVINHLKQHFQVLWDIATDDCPMHVHMSGNVPCLEGHVINEQALAYFRILATPTIRTVCEIGFNAGHSTATFLSANPDAVVYSFDLFDKAYSLRTLAYIGHAFPGRHFYYPGNSLHSVRAIKEQHPDFVCDVFSVDGGHDGDMPWIDLINALDYAHCGSLVLLDDIGSSIIQEAWERAVDAGVIEQLQCEAWMVHQEFASLSAIARGYCLGRFVPPGCPRNAEVNMQTGTHRVPFERLSWPSNVATQANQLRTSVGPRATVAELNRRNGLPADLSAKPAHAVADDGTDSITAGFSRKLAPLSRTLAAQDTKRV